MLYSDGECIQTGNHTQTEGNYIQGGILYSTAFHIRIKLCRIQVEGNVFSGPSNKYIFCVKYRKYWSEGGLAPERTGLTCHPHDARACVRAWG